VQVSLNCNTTVIIGLTFNIICHLVVKIIEKSVFLHKMLNRPVDST